MSFAIATLTGLQQAVRTDVSAVSIAPEFANRVFMLQLPSKGLHSLSLTCQLFSVSSQGQQS